MRRTLPTMVLTLMVLACCPPCLAAVSAPEHPVVSGLVDGVDLTSPESLGWSREQAETARSYSRGSWLLGFIDPLIGIVSLALLSLTGFSGSLARRIGDSVTWRPASDSLFIVAMVAGLAVLGFPLEVYRFYRERYYGFATQDLAGWMGDEIKGLILSCIIAMVFLLPIWAAIRRWPRGWWMIGSAIGVVLTVITMVVAPVFIAPLFNTFTPLKDDALKTRILALAHSQGIPAGEVYEVDASRQSRHDNAYVAGVLGTQRVVLYDTLIAAYTPEEIEFVMAHEMGHYVLNHVWKGIAFGALLIVTGFFLMNRTLERVIAAMKTRLGFDSIGSIAAVPLALLFLSSYLFIIQPATSAFSRYVEHQADDFALHLSGPVVGHETRSVAVASFQKMAARNLSDPNPPAVVEWWLYSHPSVGNRIRFFAGQQDR
ncbi:MAG TPA: M48 family metallopeptidase [Patescibacteria group bacterium]|nr:M48 family metallopeptidase [Patescibacteria group bacterium]